MSNPELTETALLLEMYKVQVARSEHFERLRASISSLLFLAAAALVGVVAADGAGRQHPALMGSTVVFIGPFGLAASTLHGRRARRHGKVAASYRATLMDLYPSFKDANARVPRERTHLNTLWTVLHVATVAVGIVVFLINRNPAQ